jgi:hypothetical protein
VNITILRVRLNCYFRKLAFLSAVSASIAVADKTYVPSPLAVIGLGLYGVYVVMRYLNMITIKVGYHHMVAI